MARTASKEIHHLGETFKVPSFASLPASLQARMEETYIAEMKQAIADKQALEAVSTIKVNPETLAEFIKATGLENAQVEMKGEKPCVTVEGEIIIRDGMTWEGVAVRVDKMVEGYEKALETVKGCKGYVTAKMEQKAAELAKVK